MRVDKVYGKGLCIYSRSIHRSQNLISPFESQTDLKKNVEKYLGMQFKKYKKVPRLQMEWTLS
jgi:hypothetical protein